MKKTFGIIAASAFAIAAIGAPVAAASDKEPNANACFGQVHKAVNNDAATQDLLGVVNVGQLVQSFDNKGQGKNAAAKTFC